MKQLSSFMVFNVNGGNRISYTYDELDNQGNILSQNKKESFYIVDNELLNDIEKIRNYIRLNKLND